MVPKVVVPKDGTKGGGNISNPCNTDRRLVRINKTLYNMYKSPHSNNRDVTTNDNRHKGDLKHGGRATPNLSVSFL